MLIKDLKACESNTIVKGFALLIKTARTPFQGTGEAVWQEVVFMDATGEMLGHILLAEHGKIGKHKETAGYHLWKSKDIVCILSASVQQTDAHKKDDMKLVVTECFSSVAKLSYDQEQELAEEEWRILRDLEINSKIRCLLTAKWIGTVKRLTLPPAEKEAMKELVRWVRNG